MGELALAGDPEQVLTVTLELAVELADARLGYAALGDPRAPSWWVARGAKDDEVAQVRERVSTTVVADALRRGEVVHTRSAFEDPRFAGAASVRRHVVGPVVCLPIGGPEAPGALYLEGRPQAPFTDSQVAGLEGLARLARAAAQRVFTQVDPAEARPPLRGPRLVGRSPVMARVYEAIAVAAPARAPVLLLGPTGVGKSTLAEAIHANGPRRGLFVALNCGLLSAERAHVDLFGAVAGAYTGLKEPRPGAVRTAHGGTLFLDEVGELATEVQSALLTFLDRGVSTPMGSDRPQASDVRIVAATTRPEALIAPLRHRLEGFPIAVPPLDARREDIPALARWIVAEAARREQWTAPALSEALVAHLVHRSWPGNVRELENVLVFGLLWAHHEGAPAIALRHLASGGEAAPTLPDLHTERLVDAVSVFRKDHCRKVVVRAEGNHTEAARRLGVSRTTLYKLLRG